MSECLRCHRAIVVRKNTIRMRDPMYRRAVDVYFLCDRATSQIRRHKYKVLGVTFNRKGEE